MVTYGWLITRLKHHQLALTDLLSSKEFTQTRLTSPDLISLPSSSGGFFFVVVCQYLKSTPLIVWPHQTITLHFLNSDPMAPPPPDKPLCLLLRFWWNEVHQWSAKVSLLGSCTLTVQLGGTAEVSNPQQGPASIWPSAEVPPLRAYLYSDAPLSVSRGDAVKGGSRRHWALLSLMARLIINPLSNYEMVKTNETCAASFLMSRFPLLESLIASARVVFLEVHRDSRRVPARTVDTTLFSWR